MNKEQEAYVKEELKLKIKFESKLIPKIKKTFRKIFKDAIDVYKISGHIINAEDYETEVESELLSHYRYVSTDFAEKTIGFVEEKIKNKCGQTEINKKAIKEKHIRDKLSLFSKKESKVRSQEITKTTNKELERFVSHGIALKITSDYKFPSKESVEIASEEIKKIMENTVLTDHSKTKLINSVIANSGAIKKDEEFPGLSVFDVRKSTSRFLQEKLNQTLDYRMNMIALTETQNAAEGAKQLVLEEYNSSLRNLFLTGEYKSKKQWIAVLDEKTRDWHAEADSQIQSIEDPFIVNNEKLMNPGDTSLGASLNNIINCRCSSMPIIYTNYNSLD